MRVFFKKFVPSIVIIVCIIIFSCVSVGAVSVTPQSNGYFSISSADRFVLHYCGNERIAFDSPHSFNIWERVSSSEWKQNENDDGIYLTAFFNENYGGYLTLPNGYTISVIMKSIVQGHDSGSPFYVPVDNIFATLDSTVGAPFSISSDDITQSDSGITKFAVFLFTNNTGSDIDFNSASMGSKHFFNSDNGASCSFVEIRYRIYSPSEMAAENISSKIDESIDQLKAEMQSQTDTVINGWSPSPESPSGSGAVDDYHSAEQSVLNSSEQGLTLGEGIVNNLGDHLSQFSDGFLFISGMVNTLFGVGFLPGLIQVSLALGIVAFFLNLAPTIFNKIGSSKSKK